MNKEELIKLSRENLRKSKQGSLCECYDEAFIKGYELSEKQIKELEKEIKVLAQNLEDTEILNKAYEKKHNDLKKENAELKADNDARKFAMAMSGKVEKQLREENAELNNFIIQSKKDGISPINALIIKNLGNQLIKAKEIIKGLLSFVDSLGNYSGGIFAKAEQFLNEVEK